ncbi:MAG: hypothetical protein CMLOHMNK_02927 [Steroidobacteraceae bacterium]|nr:hypothetical protein [Steroidobacteraceae bacterium]
MPKTHGRHKKTGAQTRKSGSPRYGKPRALADLLARPASPLVSLQTRALAAGDWLRRVRGWVPGDLAPHVTSAVERDRALTVYVASAAWAARLRFETPSLLERAREASPDVTEVRVKVLPGAR